MSDIMVEYKDVLAAADRIKGLINKTPVMSSRTLNGMLDAQVFFKCENFQRVGAFKMRGASNAVSLLTPEQKKKGVTTHSSGNHAQALALAAKLQGIKAVIVMPKTSPQVKINATRDTYGAEVVLCEPTIEARHTSTQKLINQHGYTLVHPYDNDNIIAGAGTAALELLQETGPLDILFCPVGGGGLLSGTLLASKGFSPKIQVYAVEPKNVDDAYRSLQTGSIQSNATTRSIADGLLTNLSDRTFAIIKKHIEKILTVTELEIVAAMRFLWERMKLVVEPSGAVSLAGLLSKQVPVAGKKIGVILSGGNIDVNEFFAIITKKAEANMN